MNKQEAIALFGNATELAQAIGITRQAVYQWPAQLTPRQVDSVLAALVRSGRLPSGLGAKLSATAQPGGAESAE